MFTEGLLALLLAGRRRALAVFKAIVADDMSKRLNDQGVLGAKFGR